MAEPSSLGDAVERLEAERRAKADLAKQEGESRAQAVLDMDARTGPLVTEFLAAANHIEPITFEMGSRTVTYSGRFGRQKQRYEPVLLIGHLIYYGRRRPLPAATYFGKVAHGANQHYINETRPPGGQSIIVATDGRVYASVPWESNDQLRAERAHIPGFTAQFHGSDHNGRSDHAFVSRGGDAAVGQIAFHTAYRTTRNGQHALRNGVFVWESWENIDRTFEGLRAGLAEVDETMSLLTNWCAIYLDQHSHS